MTIADRLVDAAIAQGPDSAPARLLREIVEAAADNAGLDQGSRKDALYDYVLTLVVLIDRAWLVAS